ncbi:hypothetical protein EO087_01260 [Dyella sp. M7H15-1]|nr:hypothetical protein EO087_01260 [Dyella sp. M7H15-1]
MYTTDTHGRLMCICCQYIQLTADLAGDPARAVRQLAALRTKVGGHIVSLDRLFASIGDETAKKTLVTSWPPAGGCPHDRWHTRNAQEHRRLRNLLESTADRGRPVSAPARSTSTSPTGRHCSMMFSAAPNTR